MATSTNNAQYQSIRIVKIDLLILNSAFLNEVTNGISIGEAEFATKLGYDRAEVLHFWNASVALKTRCQRPGRRVRIATVCSAPRRAAARRAVTPTPVHRQAERRRAAARRYADPSGLFSIGGLFEEVGEFATGFGDTVSGGLTRDIREGLGLAEPNYSSGAYGAGSDTGIAAAFAIPGDEEVGAAEESEAIAEDGIDASTPVGRRGSPIEVEPGTNERGEINGRSYSGHAFDRMQGRGIPPSAVDDAIANGQASVGHGGATVYSGQNGVTVVVGRGGNIVTVW